MPTCRVRERHRDDAESLRRRFAETDERELGGVASRRPRKAAAGVAGIGLTDPWDRPSSTRTRKIALFTDTVHGVDGVALTIKRLLSVARRRKDG